MSQQNNNLGLGINEYLIFVGAKQTLLHPQGYIPNVLYLIYRTKVGSLCL
jgi:hypothetical protein